jgi:hypothetical protein
MDSNLRVLVASYYQKRSFQAFVDKNLIGRFHIFQINSKYTKTYMEVTKCCKNENITYLATLFYLKNIKSFFIVIIYILYENTPQETTFVGELALREFCQPQICTFSGKN